jgi:integrase/recombinase XerD
MFYPSQVRVSGPLEDYAPGFVAELTAQGYKPLSVTPQLQLVAQLSDWLDGHDLQVSDLTLPVCEQFCAARRASGSRNLFTVRALAPLMEYLSDLGVSGPAPDPVQEPVEVLLQDYSRYLTGRRGLSLSTTEVYVRLVRPFVAAHYGRDGSGLAGLCAADISRFVLASAPGQAVASAKLLVTALRSVLGFLHVQGYPPSPLADAVPSVAGWRLAPLPKALEDAQVTRLLAGCDRRTSRGRRDFAILLMLVRLGLRSGEVAALSLDDIDWRAGELRVRGKGNHTEQLPLPVDVGEAIEGYLRRGRPATAQDRAVFVRRRAPHRQLTPAGVGAIVGAAGRRAGLGHVFAHQLRHTRCNAAPESRSRHHSDRFVAWTRERRNHTDLPTRRPRAQGTDPGPNHTPRHPTRALPPTRGDSHLATSPLIMPTSPRQIRGRPTPSASTSA